LSLGQALVELQELTERLRRDCPWDREQTAKTIVPHTVEEAYEVADAALAADDVKLLDELGDLLFQCFFLSLTLQEKGNGDLEQVARGIHDKLVRRHPHVFRRDQGEAALDSAGQVRTRWEEIQAEEREDGMKPKPLLSGIAPALPALLRAYQIGVRSASVGFDWAIPGEVVEKIQEEVDELRGVVNAETIDQSRAEEEMGDLLFSIAQLSRKLGIEPETALRKANDKFTKRFTAMERAIAASGANMSSMALEQIEHQWQQTKSEQETDS